MRTLTILIVMLFTTPTLADGFHQCDFKLFSFRDGFYEFPESIFSPRKPLNHFRVIRVPRPLEPTYCARLEDEVKCVADTFEFKITFIDHVELFEKDTLYLGECTKLDY